MLNAVSNVNGKGCPQSCGNIDRTTLKDCLYCSHYNLKKKKCTRSELNVRDSSDLCEIWCCSVRSNIFRNRGAKRLSPLAISVSLSLSLYLIPPPLHIALFPFFLSLTLSVPLSLFLSLSLSDTHIHTHTHIHTRARARPNTHSHTYGMEADSRHML